MSLYSCITKSLFLLRCLHKNSHIYNSLNPYINFTIEREADSKLPFLDLLIHRNSSSRFSFSIYRKDTHTENYLKFNSNNPVCHKRAVAKSLLDRANRLCSQNELPYELQHIKNTLRSNGYPKNFAVPQNHHHHNPHNEPVKYISTPYIPGTSERVSKIFRKFNIVLSNKPSNTLFSQFNKLKDPIPLNSKSNVVYQLNCNECNNVYIGETKKQLKERTNQHIDAVRKKSNLSLIFKHCQELNHSFNFDDPKILIQNSNVRPRKFLESFFTSGNSNSLNRCINFSEIYSPIITEITSKYSNWSAIRSILVYLSFFEKYVFFFLSNSSNRVYSFSILMLFWNYVLIFFFSLILF